MILFHYQAALENKKRKGESYPQCQREKWGQQIVKEKFRFGRKKRFRAELGRLSTGTMDNLWITRGREVGSY
jgi:hypothetical protein